MGGAGGGLANRYQYQGDNSEVEDELGWNDFLLRSYDPQIGRFLQNDPYDQFASGYVGMGNDPGNVVDPTGGWGGSSVAGATVNAVQKAGVGYDAVVTFKQALTTTAFTADNLASAAKIGIDATRLLSKLPPDPWANRTTVGPAAKPNRPFVEQVKRAVLTPQEEGNVAAKILLKIPGGPVISQAIEYTNAGQSSLNLLKDGDGVQRDLLGRAVSATQQQNAGISFFLQTASYLAPFFSSSAPAKNAVAGVADDAANASTNVYKHGFKYADRVRMRAVQDPVSHNFPYSFDDAILATKPIPKSNGYQLFQLEGTMNGKNGFFEIGLTKDGIIDHRFFRPLK